MTIAEIVEREVAAANAALGLTRKDGAIHLACSRVAMAAVEECAKIPAKWKTPTANHSTDCSCSSCYHNRWCDEAANEIRTALAAQGPGGEAGK